MKFFQNHAKTILTYSAPAQGKKMVSNKEALISTPGNEVYLSMGSFHRFSDDSSVVFTLTARSKYFDIHNFEFYSDTKEFSLFLQGLKDIYINLEGKSKISPTYESGKIEFVGSKSGQVFINCEVFCYGEIDDCCKLGIQIDQTFLPGFINQFESIYLDLGFKLEK